MLWASCVRNICVLVHQTLVHLRFEIRTFEICVSTGLVVGSCVEAASVHVATLVDPYLFPLPQLVEVLRYARVAKFFSVV